jgi:hypothetical protein
VAKTRPKAQRFSRPYRALRVHWLTRWRLEFSARTDRLAGLPIGLNEDTTPVLRGLVARRNDACEHERTRYLTAVRPLTVRLAELEADITSLERLLSQRSADVGRATAHPSERQLTLRHAGEQNLPPALIRRRRETEHRRLAYAAIAAQIDAQQRLDTARSEQAQLEARRQIRADVARSRVLRYVDHADRLAAIYRRALVHRHPQREALVQAWTTDLSVPPAWVLADELVPIRPTTGAAA